MDKHSTTSEVTTGLQQRPDIAPYARQVGQWVWIEFPGKPNEETRTYLKQSGFRWNPKRNAWQHACGVYRRFDKRGDPRLRYGESYIQAQLEASA